MRHLLATSSVVALLVTSGSAVGAQEASPDPGASPTPEQLAAAEERLATATCLGMPATIVAIAGFETLGTAGADVIVGTEGDDVIRGEGGNDRICSGPGADTVEGGEGQDQIDGGAGDDQLDGGAGNDTINGGRGADMVVGAAGNDRLSGAAGDDTLDGGKGKDICKGGPGHDWLPGCNDKKGTRGSLEITKNTTLKGPHRGSIIIGGRNNTTLDCAGHTVIGPGGGRGVYVSLLDPGFGATVKNCDVTNFREGFVVEGGRGSRATLVHNRARGNSLVGFSINAIGAKLTSNVADDNGFGRNNTYGFFVDTDDVLLRRNLASGNGEADFWLGGKRNTITGNTSTGGSFGFEIHGLRHRVERNSAVEAEGHGILLIASNSRLIDNVASDGDSEGFFVEGGGNTIEGNVASDNGSVGFADAAVPGSNQYADNICVGNRMGGSSPEDLCSDTVPVEPEPTTQAGDNTDAEGEPTAEE